jgi:hypothetical protein
MWGVPPSGLSGTFPEGKQCSVATAVPRLRGKVADRPDGGHAPSAAP